MCQLAVLIRCSRSGLLSASRSAATPGARPPFLIGALRLATRPRARTAPPRTRIAPSTMGLIVKSEINNTLYLILSFIAVFSIPVISFVKKQMAQLGNGPKVVVGTCLLYTSPSPRDRQKSRMPSSA